ncbi:PAS domain-containing protein [Oleiharenicola lentus]|uniref:PAS domain-containing sensor histidine kinase n=1 Tax=Oleiharenicola lentus TaxID=2508720 RepID=UPI003F67AF04
MIKKSVQVLVVDDDENDFFQVSHLLRRSEFVDYQFTWAKNYQEGLTTIQKDSFDVALFDYRLGASTGLELLQAVQLYRADLPVILLTGYDNPEIDFLASRAGAADYLCKNGLTRAQLERSIRYSLRHASTLAALRHSQKQLELFMHSVPCAVCICDESGVPIFQNQLAKTHFEAGDLVKWMNPDVTRPPLLHLTGDRHWLVSTFPMTDSQGTALQGFAGTDITTQVLSEQALRRTSNLLNGILSNLSVIAGRLDSDGNILEMRGSGLREIGMTEEGMRGVNLVEKCPATAAGFAKAKLGQKANYVWEMENEGRKHYFENYLHLDSSEGQQGAIMFAVNATARIEAEAERNRQARLLDGLMQKLPMLIGQLDREGRVTDVQGERLARYGLSADQLRGKLFSEVFPSANQAIERALRGQEVAFSLRGTTDDDQEWHVDLTIAPAGDGNLALFGRDVSERRWLEQQVLTASDAEQSRIGADLHDGLGQKLTGLACLASALRERLKTGDPKLAEQAALIAKFSNETISEARALARGLCPVELEQMGLVSAIHELAAQAETIHGIQVSLDMKAAAVECDHLTATHLYRITQEAINNAIRHGGAQKIEITLVSKGDTHRLTIKDDGKGFDLEAQRRARSNGLKLMDYRATMIGGSFNVESKPGEGTRITCDFNTEVDAVPSVHALSADVIT